jgi:hypothetical protein
LAAISANLFYECWNLNSVVIPADVTNISINAFYGCTKLLTVYYGGGSSQEWESLSQYAGAGNDRIQSSVINVYYYSETRPSAAGVYWHFAGGVPAVWTL